MSDVTTDELMAVAMARQIRDGDFMSHGASVPLAAAAMMLAKKLHAPNLDFFYQGTITTGERDPANLLLDMELIYRAAPAFFSQQGITDFEMRGGADFQFIRPAQIDAVGNVNTSLIGTMENPKMRFHGIAVADAMCIVKRPCLYATEHTRRVFVEELAFTTGLGHRDRDAWRRTLGLPGQGPGAVITPMAVMSFDNPDCRMQIEAVMPGCTVEAVQDATGFELYVAERVEEFAPTAEEIDTLREVDPLATRHLDFRDLRAAARQRLEARKRGTGAS